MSTRDVHLGGGSPVMISGPSWARRYGTQHRRLCARPGCGAPAAATLRFQPTQREAWLVDLDDNAARTEGDLCSRHAASLVLPRGWRLHDERTQPADPTPLLPPRHRARHASIARARRRRTDDTPRPELAAVPTPVAEAPRAPKPPRVPEREVAPPPSSSPPPASAPVDLIDGEVSEPVREELAEVLDARTPLLRRAFQNVLPIDDSPAN